MIKASQYQQTTKATEPANERIDALAVALGFTFSNGQYKKIDRRRKEHKTVAQTTAPVQRKRRTRRAYRQVAPNTYKSIRALAVGESVDVTSNLMHARITPAQFVERLYKWTWNENNMHGRPCNYAVTRNNGNAIVVRVS